MKIRAIVAEIEAQVEGMTVRNAAAMRALRRQYSKRTKRLSAGDVINIAAALIAHRRVHRFIGDELIANHPDALKSLGRTQLEQLGSGISSWDEVDCFACFLSGPCWREGQIDDNTVMEWARSKDRWWRRAALVSTVPLNVKARGGPGDARRTLRICRLLVDDRDEMVAKALSWALRALVDRDADAVRQFLQENEPRLPAIVRREVRNKLATGRKNSRSRVPESANH
jgi:3-methyladenine DNA glycosylase AlkD